MQSEQKPQPKYWFKRRRYGWGWFPVTWQGWLTLLGFIAVVIWDAFQLPAKPPQPSGAQVGRFFIILALAFAAFFLITISKSPSPRWRWGKKPGDDPDEDF